VKVGVRFLAVDKECDRLSSEIGKVGLKSVGVIHASLPSRFNFKVSTKSPVAGLLARTLMSHWEA
jgi:hypothetical protein